MEPIGPPCKRCDCESSVLVIEVVSKIRTLLCQFCARTKCEEMDAEGTDYTAEIL
jgi:hypothetical protein